MQTSALANCLISAYEFSVLFCLPCSAGMGSGRTAWWAPGVQPRSTHHTNKGIFLVIYVYVYVPVPHVQDHSTLVLKIYESDIKNHEANVNNNEI